MSRRVVDSEKEIPQEYVSVRFGASPRFWAAWVALASGAALLVFSPLDLPHRAPGTGKPHEDALSHATSARTSSPQRQASSHGLDSPEPRQSVRKNEAPSNSVRETRPAVPVRPSIPSHAVPESVPDTVVENTLVHVARRGESVTSIARHYLSQTVFMTVPELEAALRRANPDLMQAAQTRQGQQSPQRKTDGKSISPGDPVRIPGYEASPVVERSIAVAKDHEVRAIYLTGLMAGSQHGIDLVRRWKELGGNAIVFDIKDSDGSLSIPFEHDLAPRQRHAHIDKLPKYARFLHSLGLHGIARIAVFRDEQLVTHHPELAVQSRRSKLPWRENGKLVWTDPSRPEVQDYNIALARHAVASGIDEVQFDYIRFPAEGDQKDAQFVFQTAHPDWTRSKVISTFLSRVYAELHPLGVLFSLDVFGVMAWQRAVDLAHTGQDIPSMSRHCDVLSPMIYPSHFFGMDGYERPGDAPEHFIGESMERFQEITADTGVVLRPWLQAFGWRTKTYSAGYILKQVAVAKEKDGIGYLFWNARNDYQKPFLAMAEMRSAPRQPSSASPSPTKPKDAETNPARQVSPAGRVYDKFVRIGRHGGDD